MKNWKIVAGICATSLFAMPIYAKTAKEYALSYCKEYEATEGTGGRLASERWYGQDERGRFYDWNECLKTKTKEFAIQQMPEKANYQPTDAHKAYAQKFCSHSYDYEGRIWHGRVPEAEQPHRHSTNYNVYLDKEKCISEKTADAYYGSTQLDEAPYNEMTHEERAKLYCTPDGAEIITRAGKKIRGYGAGITTYDTEDACIADRVKRYKSEAQSIADAKAKGIMQPYNLENTKTEKTIVSAKNTEEQGSKNEVSDSFKGKLKASEDECAIWLCLPSGFPPGCEKAKSAMRKRVRRGHSVLPPFGACALSNDDEFSASERYVIKIEDDHGERVVPAFTCRKPGTGTGDRDYIPGCKGVFMETQVLHNGKPLGVKHYEFFRSK